MIRARPLFLTCVIAPCAIGCRSPDASPTAASAAPEPPQPRSSATAEPAGPDEVPPALRAETRAGLDALHLDPARAAVHFERACPHIGRHDPEGCHMLGVLLVDGRGIARDVPRAIALWADACEGGHGPSCATAALEYSVGKNVAKDDARALALDMRGCELGAAEGCRRAAKAFDEGIGTAPDETKTRAYLTKLCATRNATSCPDLERLDLRVRPYERAVVRMFWVGHRDAPSKKVDRSAAEAKKLVDVAVAELGKGRPFDEVADHYGGASRLDRIGRDEQILFRMKPGSEQAFDAFTLKPGQAKAVANSSFGFVVWYRAR